MANASLDNLKSKKSDLVESFNKVAINMITHLGNEFQDSIFAKNKTMIILLIFLLSLKSKYLKLVLWYAR